MYIKKKKKKNNFVAMKAGNLGWRKKWGERGEHRLRGKGKMDL